MKKDAASILAMRVGGTIFWMLYTVVLARTLPSVDFAQVLYVINFALVSVLVVTIGRDVTLLRFASIAWAGGGRHAVRKILSRNRRFVLGTSLAFMGALYIASQFNIQSPVTKEPTIALLTGLLIVASAQMGLNRDCLRAADQVWQSQLGLNFTRSIIPIAGAIVAYFGSIEMTAVFTLSLFLASLILSLVLEEMFIRHVDWTDTNPDAAIPSRSELARTGLTIWPGDLSNAVMMRAVGLIGAALLPPHEAALLLAAERIASLVQFPISASAQAAGPKIAQATHSGKQAVQNAVDSGSKLMVIGSMIGCAGTAVMAWPALLAFGPDYMAALPATLILIAGCAAWTVFGLAQTTLNLIGRSELYSVISFTMACLTILAVSFGTFAHGMVGAALGWSVGWWLTNIIYTIALSRFCGLKSGLLAVSFKKQGWN